MITVLLVMLMMDAVAVQVTAHLHAAEKISTRAYVNATGAQLQPTTIVPTASIVRIAPLARASMGQVATLATSLLVSMEQIAIAKLSQTVVHAGTTPRRSRKIAEAKC